MKRGLVTAGLVAGIVVLGATSVATISKLTGTSWELVDVQKQVATLEAEKSALVKEVEMLKTLAVAGTVYKDALKRAGRLEAVEVSIEKELNVPVFEGPAKIGFDVADKCRLYVDAGFDESDKNFIMIPTLIACESESKDGNVGQSKIEGFIISPSGKNIDARVVENENGEKSAILAAGMSFEVFYRATDK